MGDLVQLNISGGTAPYTWQSSNDGISWSTLSGASGTAYTHKVADKTFIRVKDSNGSITNVVELTPSIRCDKDHTITIFKETFGTLSGVDERASYSKNNVPVDGTNITYTASVPYKASTVSCGAMTDGGYYAVLANPRNAGCGTNIAQGTQNCNCVDDVNKDNTRWYRNTTDHTGDTNGGMLMYNCKDGTSTTDVLYECIINGICANTYINFSAFVTCANRGLHGNIPIEAEFKLFNADTGSEIDTYEVKNIGLSEEWKEIAAMFNSKEATSVKIQLINKAGQGQGNDLLFDDMSLSVCTPEADLVFSDGVSTEVTIPAGSTETLTASILSGIMTNPFYLWLSSTDKDKEISQWDKIGSPEQNKTSITTNSTTTTTIYYQVVIANTFNEALNVANGLTGTACGMHAITNIATLNVSILPITFSTHPKNEIVCEGSGVTFKVEAANAETYQWQKSTNNVDWVDIEGKTGTTYQIISTTKEDDNTYYRVKATNIGGTAYSNSAKLTVNGKATIADITAPSAICAGDPLSLPTPVITYNGSTVTEGKWYLDGAVYTAGESVPYSKNGKKLQYKAKSSCGGEIKSNEVTIIVNDKATIADITAPEAICAGDPLSLPTPIITYNGSTVTDGKWYLDGAEYTAGTAVPYTSNGKTLQYKATSSCGGEIKSNEVTVTVDALPEVTFSATDVTLNCTTSTATITASGAYKYEWSYLDQTGATQTKSGSTLALQQTDPEVSSLVTEYTVYGYSENANCKSEEAKTIKVTEDFVKPVVDIKISETADGTIPERLDCYQQNIKLEADLTNNKETIVEYIWSSGSDNNTTLINNPGAYTLQVKGENGCISDVATETIEQNIVKPEVSIESYITDPVTGNIIPTVELTCANNEITLEGTITNAEQYAEDYPNGEFTYLWSDGSTTSSTVAKTPLATSPMEYTLIVKSPNGCLNDVDKAKVTVTENVSAPVLNIESVYKLCPSDTLSVKALSSLLPNTSGVTYKFYDKSGEEIEDLYDASSADAITEYYVTGVSANGCQSEKTSFEVDFAKNVDFTLTTSQSSMMVGGNETIVEIVPDADSDDAATYVWTANDQELSVDGLQYVDNLYLDTNFKVTASNRCDSDTQEAFVEVLWPTAFTPHNGNGKNDTFAKGMKLMVFNRFYTKIFEGEDGWDGSINGTMNSSKQTAVPGVYFYSVQLPNGEVKKGTIEIIKVD